MATNNRSRKADDVQGSSNRHVAANKRQCRNSSFGYDVYIAGKTRKTKDWKESDSQPGLEASFQLALKRQNVKDIFCKKYFPKDEEDEKEIAYVLLQNGVLKQWGNRGEIWDMSPHQSRFLFRGAFLTNIQQVDSGEYHAAAISYAGSVITWGDNDQGQLGRNTGNEYRRVAPGRVESLQDLFIIQVACDKNVTFALDKQGNIYSWGSHESYGVTGQGVSEGSSSQPTKIEGLPPVKQICASGYNAGALTRDGNVYTWGYGETSGHDGYSEEECITRPALLRGRLDGQIVVQLSCGGSHMGALTDKKHVYMWGWNGEGQLGTGVSDHDEHHAPTLVEALIDECISSISLGDNHSIAMSKERDTVFVWGQNEIGQLGLGSTKGKQLVPEKIKQLFRGKVTKICALPRHSVVLVVDPHSLEKSNIGNFVQSIRGLFNNPASHADVKFTLNGDTICYAHKSILSSRCSYFDTMFQTTMKESSQNEFPIRFSKEVFMKVMQHIYGIDVNGIEAIQVPELYKASDFYHLDELKKMCTALLERALTIQNVGHVLESLCGSENDFLEMICMDFLKANKDAWMKDRRNLEQINSNSLLKKIVLAFNDSI